MGKALPWVLVGALGAWMIVQALRPPVDVPDTTAPYVDSLRAATAAREAAEARADSVRAALADSTVLWVERDRALRAQASTARAEASRASQELRAVLDTAGVRMLDAVEALHEAEVTALEAIIVDRDAEIVALRTSLDASDMVLAGMRTEIERWAALDGERQRIESTLRGEIRRQNRDKRILAVAGVGLAIMALR